MENLSIEVEELKQLYIFYKERYKKILNYIQEKKGNSNFYYWLGFYHYKIVKIKDKLKLCENVDLI